MGIKTRVGSLVFLLLTSSVVLDGVLKEPRQLAQIRRSTRSSRDLPHPKVYRCGDMGSDLVSNFINKKYPNNDQTSGECNYRLIISSPHICQIRVDFVDTELIAPVRGECVAQKFEVQGTVWPTGLPPLCGFNNDQHFYLHLESWSANTSFVDFKVTTRPAGKPYRFGVWISQIDCSNFNNVLKAPEGCTQWWLGEKGTIKSFNFDGSRYLNGQNYQMCIRPGKGVCGVKYEAAKQGDFSMRKSITARRDALMRSGTGSGVCATDYLYIPEGRESMLEEARGVEVRRERLLFRRRRPQAPQPQNSVTPTTKDVKKNRGNKKVTGFKPSWDRFCGGSLAPSGGQNDNRPIYAQVRSNLISMRVKTSTKKVAENTKQNLNLTMGYKLFYTQLRDCDEKTQIDMASQPTIVNLIQNFHIGNGFTHFPPVFRETDAVAVPLTFNDEPTTKRNVKVSTGPENVSSSKLEILQLPTKPTTDSTANMSDIEESDEDELWDYLEGKSDFEYQLYPEEEKTSENEENEENDDEEVDS